MTKEIEKNYSYFKQLIKDQDFDTYKRDILFAETTVSEIDLATLLLIVRPHYQFLKATIESISDKHLKKIDYTNVMLNHAVDENLEDIVELLLKKGINPNASSARCILDAYENGNRKIIKLLEDSGADLSFAKEEKENFCELIKSNTKDYSKK